MKIGSLALIICLLGLALASADGSSLETGRMRVMSFNIRYNNPADGIHAWANRKAAVAEMIRRYQVDLAGIQEVLKEQLEDLSSSLSDYGWVGVGRDDGKEKGEFSPIFYKKGRLKVLEKDTFWLSETPDIPGGRSWDAAITRIVTWVRFEDSKSEKKFYHFNTHFDHRGEEARRQSARLLVQKIRQIAKRDPVVLTGDLNLRPGTDPYIILLGEGLSDAYFASRTGHTGPTATFTNWEEPGPADSRIDYVFVKNRISVLSHQVLTDRFRGYFPSDHLPVLVEIELPRR